MASGNLINFSRDFIVMLHKNVSHTYQQQYKILTHLTENQPQYTTEQQMKKITFLSILILLHMCTTACSTWQHFLWNAILADGSDSGSKAQICKRAVQLISFGKVMKKTKTTRKEITSLIQTQSQPDMKFKHDQTSIGKKKMLYSHNMTP